MKPIPFVHAAVTALVFAGCATVPETGRHQLMLMSQSEENAQGVAAYGEYKTQNKISTNVRYTEALNRCGAALKSVAGRDDFDWEFTLFDSKTENAFCLPGGKVAFYSGIVDKMDNEAEMAFVMAHEVAHAIARHGGEKVSWNKLCSLGGALVAIGFKNDTINEIYGIGSQVGVTLPFSRRDESEADFIGLKLMARAGYDPDAAPAFWKRFAAGHAQTSAIDNILSTHPCDADRIKAMEENLAAAKEEYAKATTKRGYGEKFR